MSCPPDQSNKFSRHGQLAPAIALVVAVLSATVAGLGYAQTPPEAPPQPIRVVAKPVEPFVFEEDGRLKGYSIDLWNRIADDMDRRFEVQMVQTIPNLITALRKEQADVGVGAISITDERETLLDFSHPFFESGLQVLVRSEMEPTSALRAFGQLLSGPLLKAVLIILGAVFLVSNILWWFERRVNHGEFPHHYFRGLWESTWWSISTLISGGCENKSPVGVPGRMIAVIWMLAGIALTSFITASLASSMTLNSLNTEVASLSDLGNAKIGTVTGSSAAAYLKKKHYRVEGFDNEEEAIKALERNQVKAVVYDSPILMYYVAKHPESRLQVIGSMFELQDYGFAMPLKSELRKQINATIHKLKFTGYLDELELKWGLRNIGK